MRISETVAIKAIDCWLGDGEKFSLIDIGWQWGEEPETEGAVFAFYFVLLGVGIVLIKIL